MMPPEPVELPDTMPGEIMHAQPGTLVLTDLPADDGRPLLLIDVDGVLNVISRSQNHKTYDFHLVETGDGFRFRIQFRKELRGWLDRLIDHYVPVWCTMWDDEANTCLAPLLDLPSFPYIPCGDNGREALLTYKPGPQLHHKMPMISERVGTRAFAWLDDEIGDQDLLWAEMRDDQVAPTKFMKIDSRMGLLEHHVNKLVRWAELIK